MSEGGCRDTAERGLVLVRTSASKRMGPLDGESAPF